MLLIKGIEIKKKKKIECVWHLSKTGRRPFTKLKEKRKTTKWEGF